MPTEREREYYAMGYRDGFDSKFPSIEATKSPDSVIRSRKPKRKLSAWNKYVKAHASDTVTVS